MTDELESLCTHLSNKMLQYMEAIDYSIGDEILFVNSKGETKFIKDISHLQRVCLYIDSRHCTSCWKDEIRNLSDWCDSVPFSVSPIIIANNFNERELKIMQQGTEYEIYSIGDQVSFLSPLTKFNVPFYFVINQEGHACCPYFPTKSDMGKFPKRYFTHVCSLTSNKNNKAISEGVKKLALLNENVQLGEIPYRKKISIKYKMKNLCNKPCKIFECLPSCSCILVDSFSSVIPPGEIGYLSITTVQNNKGVFDHSVRIHSDFSLRPYEVKFAGVCK